MERMWQGIPEEFAQDIANHFAMYDDFVSILNSGVNLGLYLECVEFLNAGGW